MFDLVRRLTIASVAASAILLFSASAAAQDSSDSSIAIDSQAVREVAETVIPPRPAQLDTVTDSEGDAGRAISVRWVLSPDDGVGADNVTGYEIFRSESPDGEFESIGFSSRRMTGFEDATTTDGMTYFYYVKTVSETGSSQSAISSGTRSSAQWFNTRDTGTLIIGFIICFSVIYFIYHAQMGKKLFLRKIAGLEAVDEAIGRATEMGRPILFIPGIQDLDNVQTVAAITILGRIARTIADYDTKINMPVSRSLVMTTARETIKQAYVGAGRPDAYSDDMVYYLTDEQFGYVAAVDGIMVREKPATCFYLGAF